MSNDRDRRQNGGYSRGRANTPVALRDRIPPSAQVLGSLSSRFPIDDVMWPKSSPCPAVLDCPVSLIMRYGQRAELQCLNYMRRLRASVVSPSMRQIDAPSVLSHQVKEPVPHLGETPTRMPHIRVTCLGLDETGQHTRQCRLRGKSGRSSCAAAMYKHVAWPTGCHAVTRTADEVRSR